MPPALQTLIGLQAKDLRKSCVIGPARSDCISHDVIGKMHDSNMRENKVTDASG
jgi:hypothetical protein